MAVTCRDIMELDVCRKFKLLGGAGGLNHIVTWPYIKNMDTISEWTHGGELIFVIGAKDDISEDGLLTVMEEAVKKGIAGVVMLYSEDYIRKIPKQVIQFADENDMPLFKQPFRYSLLDITREISDFILKDRNMNLGYLKQKEDTVFDILFRNISKEESIGYCWMKLQPLLEADRVLKSQYVITLKNYLWNNNDLIKTSRAMFIHRNTLVNRIKKIDYLLGMNVNDVETRYEFYNIFKILEFYGEI